MIIRGHHTFRMRLASSPLMLGLMVATVLSVTVSSRAVAGELSPAQVYAAAAPATVFIIAASGNGGSSGTGSIVDRAGLVLTNAHVIMDKQAKVPYEAVFVFLKPARVSGRDKENLANRFKATVVAYQEALDLALLKINEAPPSLPVLPMGDSSGITIGSRVLAIGHPERGGLWSLTTGVISAEWKDYGGVPGWDVFQTETSLNRGNSGGPLVDEHGNQIGVNSFIQRRSEDGLAITSINFAIKSSVAREWLARQGVSVAYAKRDLAESRTGGDTATIGPATAPTATSTVKEGPRPDGKAPKAQPAKVLENQPEAQPETGPGLPPLRPFSLDQLVKGLALVQKDLESQMEDMEAEIQKRR
ncbi:MAG: serine protease [Nitrospiraceae bacterium]